MQKPGGFPNCILLQVNYQGYTGLISYFPSLLSKEQKEKMNRLLKLILVIVSILVVLVVAGGIAGMVVARRPFPTTDGTLTIPGLQEEVRVVRDEYGVPYIYANNQDDLFFAQGYVHAQDRFWQMEFWRHIGQGRISEIVGEPGLDSDKFIRTVGWNRMAQNTIDYYENEAPEFYHILQAYSAGVNAYIEQNRDTLSVNYTILGLVNEPWEIEPWEPVDTVAWGVVMAHDLSGNYGEELDRANLIKELGEAEVSSLLPFYPYNTRPVIAPTSEQVNELPEARLDGDTVTAVLQTAIQAVDWSRVNTNVVGTAPHVLGEGPFVGSNNWVISGEHTDTGMPLLANDPHLGIQMPSIWYEVGLHAPDYNVHGVSFAGVPGVIIGHNDHIAWGVTNVGPDVQDLFIEKINPSNPSQYEFMGEWVDMEVVEEVIKVNGGEDVTLQVRITQHGPIMNEVFEDQSDVLAFKWTATEASRVLQSVVLLNTAENYDDFREALRYWDLPSQNFVYADVEGNIAYQMPGLVPIRKNGNGLVPVPGWTGEYEWEGWIPYEELPALFNPEQGYIVTANHAVVDEDYPYLITLYWADGDRGQRIVDMIKAQIDGDGAITADDIATIQFDNKLLLADSYIPLLDGLSSDDPQVQAALERLRGWDGQMLDDSVPAALFGIFNRELAYRLLTDEVGEENVNRISNRVFLHQISQQASATWWDDETTETAETREQILLAALADTVTWFEENVGGDMNEWTWGKLHTATFVSTPLGESGVGLIEGIVNRGPFPASGSSSSVNANGWSWDNPAVITAHPSMRMIQDLSNFDNSRLVIPTGQSGHPYHAHYDDQIQLWLDGEQHAMYYTQEVVDGVATDTLVLQPGE